MTLTDMNVGVMVIVIDNVATVHIACDNGNGIKIWMLHFTLSYDNLADGKINLLSAEAMVAAREVSDGKQKHDCLVIARAVSLAAVQRERDRMQALIKDAYL